MGRNRDDSAQMWQRDATCITVSTSNTNPSQSTQCRAGFTCPSGSMGSGCLLEVRFCPQTSWNGLCMAYAWPMHGHMHLDAIFLLYQELVASQRAQTQTSATHSRCIWPCLGHQLKIWLVQNMFFNLVRPLPHFHTFSNTCWVICNFAIIHLCCHAMCWEATVASQQHASLPALPAPMETIWNN